MLVERIAAQGPAASVDVDQAALRVTLDVIGLVRRAGLLREGQGGLHFDRHVSKQPQID
jgi:hypothetical protein